MRVFARQTSRFCVAVETRLLPAFDSIENEAEQAADAEWERLVEIADPEYADPADLAERAQEAGIEYYESLEGVRQAILNLSAAALYHLLEQQLLLFHRRQVLDAAEENIPALNTMAVLRERLQLADVRIEALQSWSKVDELHAVANVVKHAEGHSAAKLRRLRPDLFRHPSLREPNRGPLATLPHVNMPLAGEDVFVTVEDLKAYCAALVEFWEQLGAAIQ
jgi:hypothetical protein